MDPIWEEINEAIHNRDTESVHRLIRKYLRAQGSSPAALYEASEFYRKITDYSNALRVLPKEQIRSNKSRVSDADTKLALQLARLLNILGASDYALRMVDRIRRDGRARSKIEMIEIYQCNYKYTEVIELLGPDYPVPRQEPWHQDWLLHFYFANGWNGLSRQDLAIDRMQKIRALTASPLIRAMTYCYEGKYLVASGKFDKALPAFFESQKYFKATDHTADHAILKMHMGQCFLKLRKFHEAKQALTSALKVFYSPGHKPEDWMEIVLMLEQIPGYRRSDESLAPRLFELFGSEYPPLTRSWLHESANVLSDSHKIFSLHRVETRKCDKHIDRESDTFWDRGKVRLGLDLVDELIWNLIYSGEYGIPQFKLYALLWPNEPFSFDQHQKRLERVVGRARKQGYKIEWRSLHLWLHSEDVSTSGRPHKMIRGASFLSEHPSFKISDMQMYFSISSTSAKVLCREWLGSGLIVSAEKAKYRVNQKI